MQYRFLYILLITVLISGIWTACDKIEKPLILLSEQIISDGEGLLDTVYVVDSVYVADKHVLLEDFTGHKCVNCPEAALSAHQWAEENGHRLIIYGIHAGFYATPDATGEYTADFTCPTGNEIFSYFLA